MFLLTMDTYAQRGPGGVSEDGDQQRNCRLWLDAGDLNNLIDGDTVNVWYDKSISAIRDSAFRDPMLTHKYICPLFRNSPASSINGKPVVSFESGGMLGIGKWPNGSYSGDLNSNPGMVTTYQQTIFIAFRTSNDVEARQILWEEGGAARGVKVYIYNGEIYIGAYDVGGGDNDANTENGDDHVDGFGFTYKKMPVQANTTYILSHVYDVPTDNSLIYNTTVSTHSGLTGTLNGQAFPSTMQRGIGTPGHSYCENCAEAVGGIYLHQDPVGIGGMNQGSYSEIGRTFGGHSNDDPVLNFTRRNESTGTNLFTGRIAEICYYAYALDKAEQIIVENYLAAKYFANVIANDKYVYQSSFGDGVIGIGRAQSTPDVAQHNQSQGDNLFEISVANMSAAFNTSPQYLLVGHNNAAITWTPQNTPDSASIQRLQRIWRWDQSGGIPNIGKDVIIKLYPQDIAKLPPLPTGFTKYGVIVGDAAQSLPNFGPGKGQVFELSENGVIYEAVVSIKDGNYFTLCAIKPIVEFQSSTDFAIEGNSGTTPKTATLNLNYTPAVGTSFDVDFDFINGTATLNTDYGWTPGDSPVTFLAGQTSKTIGFYIVNDAVTTNDLAVEAFTIEITGANNGLSIGAKSTLTYTIYDNDPPPKVTFTEDAMTFNESDGTLQIPVNVIGNLTGSATAEVEYVSASGTATESEDFNAASPQTLHFDSGTLTDHFVIDLIDDATDEYDEHFQLRIVGVSGTLGFEDTLNVEMQINITDNDLEPVVSFVSTSSEGYETISEPHILVKLSASSAKEISVPFDLTGGSATNGATASGGDYSADPGGGTLIFSPGDSVRVLYFQPTNNQVHLIVYGNDATNESPETIIFELANELVNASLGAISGHTYTIRDYSAYEWRGVAGVGTLLDNTFWMVPNAATDGSNIPNLTIRPIEIVQNSPANTPSLTTQAGGLNNKKLINFDGTNDFLIPGDPNAENAGQSALIQMAAFYDSKSIFMVIIPEKVNSNTPQCIFESGAQRGGMSIYIIQNTLYFQAWGWQDNRTPHVLWGLNPSNQYKSIAYTTYTGLEANEPYIISCHHENNSNGTETIAGLSLFVNGVLVDTYTGPVNRIQSNVGSAALGSVLWQSRFFDTKYFAFQNGQNTVPSIHEGDHSNHFDGKMGDVLYYNEPRMNRARVRIITNFLSAKYNIPLGTSQEFGLDYADNTTTTYPDFNHDVAGVGKIGDDVHGDAKGRSQLRVRNADMPSSGDAFLMWGDNGKTFTNIWPVSNMPLPADVEERSEKIWRFSDPGNLVAKADLYFNYSQAENASQFMADLSLLKLLVHHNTDPDDFSNATVYSIEPNLNITGPIAYFTEVPISDGMYVTLGNASPIIPLPITLLNFDATLNGNHVDITWSTASESNNERFEIERAGADLKWEKISEAPGAGNSNTLLYYREKDRNPLPGISYYRLRQVDYDGNFTYSNPVSVINSNLPGGNEVFIYPNPVRTGSVILNIPYAYSKVESQITIYDLSGKTLLKTTLESDQKTIQIDIGSLDPGAYLIHIHSSLLNESKKLIVQ